MENTYNVGSLSLDSHALTKHVTKRKYNGLPRLYEWSNKNVWHHTGLCPVRFPAVQARLRSLLPPLSILCDVWRVFPIVQSGVTTFQLISWPVTVAPRSFIIMTVWHWRILVWIKRFKPGLFKRQCLKEEEKVQRTDQKFLSADIKDSTELLPDKPLCFVAHCRCLVQTS